jgi:hypothetical protein
MSNEQQKDGDLLQENVESPEVQKISEADPLAGKKPELSKSFRDWGAFTLSALAFVISAAGFYMNTLMETDDLRLVIPQESGARITLNKDDSISVENAGSAVLVNAGNRTTVVVGYDHVGTYGKDTKPKDCRSQNQFMYPDEKFKPLVIRPGEAASFEIGSSFLPGKFAYIIESGDTVVECLRFYIATPSEEPAPVDAVFISRHVSSKNKKGLIEFEFEEDSNIRTNSVRAITLVKSSHLRGG